MRVMRLVAAIFAVGLLGTGSAWAHEHGRVHFGFYLGAPWDWPGYYYPPPYYYPPVVTVPAAPPVYIERDSEVPKSNYWYYCAAAKSYYPYVKECPGGWQKVAPQPEQGR
jgi:hypothetical protein